MRTGPGVDGGGLVPARLGRCADRGRRGRGSGVRTAGDLRADRDRGRPRAAGRAGRRARGARRHLPVDQPGRRAPAHRRAGGAARRRGCRGKARGADPVDGGSGGPARAAPRRAGRHVLRAVPAPARRGVGDVARPGRVACRPPPCPAGRDAVRPRSLARAAGRTPRGRLAGHRPAGGADDPRRGRDGHAVPCVRLGRGGGAAARGCPARTWRLRRSDPARRARRAPGRGPARGDDGPAHRRAGPRAGAPSRPRRVHRVRRAGDGPRRPGPGAAAGAGAHAVRGGPRRGVGAGRAVPGGPVDDPRRAPPARPGPHRRAGRGPRRGRRGSTWPGSSRLVRARATAALPTGTWLTTPDVPWEQVVLPPEGALQLHDAVAGSTTSPSCWTSWGMRDGATPYQARGCCSPVRPAPASRWPPQRWPPPLRAPTCSWSTSRRSSRSGSARPRRTWPPSSTPPSAPRPCCCSTRRTRCSPPRTEISDAHDRYANLETAYLLQRLDRFEGLVDADHQPAPQHRRRLRAPDGLRRRLPAPGPRRAPRAVGAAPARGHVAADVDARALARLYAVAGGWIRNARSPRRSSPPPPAAATCSSTTSWPRCAASTRRPACPSRVCRRAGPAPTRAP